MISRYTHRGLLLDADKLRQDYVTRHPRATSRHIAEASACLLLRETRSLDDAAFDRILTRAADAWRQAATT